MSIFAIGDLHLSHRQDKPMEVFGPEWRDHPRKIRENWQRVVGAGDLVIVPGDVSWAMRLEEAAEDLGWLSTLPGTKLLLRGNHDYWWQAIGKVRSALPANIHALQNDCFLWEEWAICGTRGWICPGEEGFDEEHDRKIYLREIERLRLSLKSAPATGRRGIIAALHYPPFYRPGETSGFTALLEEYGVDTCLFAHIHGAARERVFQGELNGITYRFVAADGVNFTPVLIK